MNSDDRVRAERPSTSVDHSIRVLSRRDVAALMKSWEYVEPVEAAFRCLADESVDLPLPMHIAADGGSFHVKGCFVDFDQPFVAVKLNANYPGNGKLGLPTIQGVVLLCEGESGTVLAFLDSMELTARRAAAASALAARHLARNDANVIAICGCGVQGQAHLEVLAHTLHPSRIVAWDVDKTRAISFARQMADKLGLEVAAVPDIADAAGAGDVIVTATRSSPLPHTHRPAAWSIRGCNWRRQSGQE